jgi:4-hydroxy-tetrahydrodipicolinate synthase
MTRPRFKGAIPALVTPFKDGAIDEAAFKALVERQIKGGVKALVPVGTTGESTTLSHEEHRRVVELCVQTAAGRVPVIAGAGSNSTEEAIGLVRHAKEVGADAALVVTPYYNRPSQEGLYRHYHAIHEAVDLPLILYNVPTRTSVDMSNETVARLAKLPNVVGIKDATSDLARPSIMRHTCGEDFVLLSGEDASALGYMAHGGHGCISVTVNVAPEAMSGLIDACLDGDYATALAWQDKLIGLHKALFADASPAPSKFALAQLGLCSEEVRLPLAPCSEAARGQVLEAMRAAGINWS